MLLRLSENAHLPFDWLTVLSKAEGLRYPHPSSLRRTFRYASFLGISSHASFDRLTALSKAEGLRYPHPSLLRRTQKAKGRR